MTVRLKILFAFVLCFGLLFGCSSSDGPVPEDGGISGTGVGNANAEDANTNDVETGAEDTGAVNTSSSEELVIPASEVTGGATTAGAGTGGTTAGAGTDGTTAGDTTTVGTTAGNAIVEETIDEGIIDLNGDYNITVSLSEASTAVPECEEATGLLNVTGTTITGIVDDTFTITGSISSDGTISGGFALEDGNPFASYNGMLDGEDLVGEWSDVRGCGGTWRAVKIVVE